MVDMVDRGVKWFIVRMLEWRACIKKRTSVRVKRADVHQPVGSRNMTQVYAAAGT